MTSFDAHRRLTIRTIGATIAVFAALPRTAAGEDVEVPIALQAQLLVKVAGYDKSLPHRAGGLVRILLVVNPATPESARASTQMERALEQVGPIDDLPHEESTISFSTPTALAALCKKRRIAIVYITPGFSSQIEGIRAAMEGVDVLTVAAVADYVSRGIVLGFDLVSGKPKLLTHMAQAKKQNVVFKSEVLKIMRRFE
ncbi:MAG: hypothetical protein NVS3B20_01750 [Polyangiales bacterium]